MREKFRENKLQMLIKKILYTSDLVSTTILTTKISEVENKILNTNNLLTTNVLNPKPSDVENKISDYCKRTTTQEFNKLIAEHFVARLKQADLVNKADFDNKLFHLLEIKQNI